MTAKKGARSHSSSLRSRGIGCLFWLCLVAIIVAVGYAARAQLANTFTRLTGGGAHPDAHQPATHVEVTRQPLQAPPDALPEKQQTQSPTSPAPAASERVATSVHPSAAAPIEKPAVRKTRLFFLTVDQAGTIKMKGVIRPIPQSDSPLRDALETLLKGPTAQEINLGLLTMIPTGTSLRGVVVRDEVAYVDFSESFRFNSLGVDGMKAQLRQVVYAATEFATVKRVQFLIEGKKVDYLGTEGVRIDQPLSRGSF